MPSHIVRSLHDEHMATLALLERLEALLGRRGPAAESDAAAAFLGELARAVELELGPHFTFEESHLFPLLAEAGAQEMTALLTQEHAELLPRARRLAELARRGQAQGFDPTSWTEFHAVGAALAGALAAHVEKEEMGLLPALEDLLDAETDGRFAMDYAALR